MMKDMGANAIRTSHNMPAVELLDIADEIGLLVDNEAFDMWKCLRTDMIMQGFRGMGSKGYA